METERGSRQICSKDRQGSATRIKTDRWSRLNESATGGVGGQRTREGKRKEGVLRNPKALVVGEKKECSSVCLYDVECSSLHAVSEWWDRRCDWNKWRGFDLTYSAVWLWFDVLNSAHCYSAQFALVSGFARSAWASAGLLDGQAGCGREGALLQKLEGNDWLP